MCQELTHYQMDSTLNIYLLKHDCLTVYGHIDVYTG